MSVQETIQNPLSFVQQLFDKHVEDSTTSPLDFDPSPHFSVLFQDQQELLQIPSLNQVPASLLQKNSLVRFRCMLQDTGLGQEMSVSFYKKMQAHGSDKLTCHWYSDDYVDREPGQETVILNEQLRERSLFYCVSPPGETLWVKNASYNSSDTTEVLNATNIQESASSSSTLKQKYPLVNKSHVSAIVKIYSDSDALRVGQLVDIIGVLGSFSTTTAHMTEMAAMDAHELFDTHLVQFKDTPVLHAITCKTVQGTMEVTFFTKTQLDDSLGEARDTRGPLIDYIATYFGGDKLVSEFVLLQLLSKIKRKAWFENWSVLSQYQ